MEQREEMAALRSELNKISDQTGFITVIIQNGYKCRGKLLEINELYVKITNNGKAKCILMSAISTFE